MDGSEAVCALGVTLHSHSQFSPSYTRGGCFILGSLCSILRFLRKVKLSKEEAKVWEGEKKERKDLQQCARSECDSALTLKFLAFLHLTLFSREFSLFQNLQNEKQPTSTGSVSMGEQSHSQGDVSY